MKGEPTIDSINELRIWLEGEFKVIALSHKTANENLTLVRQRVHDLAQEVTKVVALNLEDKFKLLGEHDAALDKLGDEALAARSAFTAVKAAYATAGAVFGGAATLVLAVSKIIHL